MKINDLASCFKDGHAGHIGKQSMETEGRAIPLLCDGSKCYLKICEPTDKEVDLYPIIELTSPLPIGTCNPNWHPSEDPRGS